MLLNEIVIDLASRLKHNKDKAGGNAELEIEIPDTIGAPKLKNDEIGNKRRSKMKPSDQLRDFAKQLGKRHK